MEEGFACIATDTRAGQHSEVCIGIALLVRLLFVLSLLLLVWMAFEIKYIQPHSNLLELRFCFFMDQLRMGHERSRGLLADDVADGEICLSRCPLLLMV